MCVHGGAPSCHRYGRVWLSRPQTQLFLKYCHRQALRAISGLIFWSRNCRWAHVQVIRNGTTPISLTDHSVQKSTLEGLSGCRHLRIRVKSSLLVSRIQILPCLTMNLPPPAPYTRAVCENNKALDPSLSLLRCCLCSSCLYRPCHLVAKSTYCGPEKTCLIRFMIEKWIMQK